MGIFHKHTSRLKIQRIYKKCPGYMSPPSLPFQALSFQPGCEQLHWFMIIIISSLPTSPCALVTHRVHLLPGWALQLLDATCMEAVCWLGMMCTMCICIYCLGKGSKNPGTETFRGGGGGVALFQSPRIHKWKKILTPLKIPLTFFH